MKEINPELIFAMGSGYDINLAMTALKKDIVEKMHSQMINGRILKCGNLCFATRGEHFYFVMPLIDDSSGYAKNVSTDKHIDPLRNPVGEMLPPKSPAIGSATNKEECQHTQYGNIAKEDGSTYVGCIQCKQPIANT